MGGPVGMEDNLEEYEASKSHLLLRNTVPCYWKTSIPKTPQLEERKHTMKKADAIKIQKEKIIYIMHLVPIMTQV